MNLFIKRFLILLDKDYLKIVFLKLLFLKGMLYNILCSDGGLKNIELNYN